MLKILSKIKISYFYTFTINLKKFFSRILNNRHNNNNIFNLQDANSPSRLWFEANLSRERSELYRARSRPNESNLYREDSL